MGLSVSLLVKTIPTHPVGVLFSSPPPQPTNSQPLRMKLVQGGSYWNNRNHSNSKVLFILSCSLYWSMNLRYQYCASKVITMNSHVHMHTLSLLHLPPISTLPSHLSPNSFPQALQGLAWFLEHSNQVNKTGQGRVGEDSIQGVLLISTPSSHMHLVMWWRKHQLQGPASSALSRLLKTSTHISSPYGGEGMIESACALHAHAQNVQNKPLGAEISFWRVCVWFLKWKWRKSKHLVKLQLYLKTVRKAALASYLKSLAEERGEGAAVLIAKELLPFVPMTSIVQNREHWNMWCQIQGQPKISWSEVYLPWGAKQHLLRVLFYERRRHMLGNCFPDRESNLCTCTFSHSFPSQEAKGVPAAWAPTAMAWAKSPQLWWQDPTHTLGFPIWEANRRFYCHSLGEITPTVLAGPSVFKLEIATAGVTLHSSQEARERAGHLQQKYLEQNSLM